MAGVFGERQIAICREMTKTHEELVTGPISGVIKSLNSLKGEFTIVLSPQESLKIQPEIEDILIEFGQITKSSGTKRQAIKKIAEKYGMSAQTVYKLLEENKQQ